MLYGNGGYVLHSLTVSHSSTALSLVLRTTYGTHIFPNLEEFIKQGWK